MQPLIAAHVALAVLSLAIGGALLAQRKGAASHKLLGRRPQPFLG